MEGITLTKNNLKNALADLEQVILFKNIKKDSLLLKLKESLKNDNLNFSNLIHDLVKLSINEGLNGDLWHNYLKKLIINSDNIFSLKAEKSMIEKNNSLYQLAFSDLKIINNLFSFSFADILDILGINSFDYLKDFKLSKTDLDLEKEKIYSKIFNTDSVKVNLRKLISFYNTHGAGILNESRAFYWQEKDLIKINNPDSITFKQLISYQKEKKKLIKNTQSFLNGFQAQNVLLYGDSGTGKSSSVKALLNKYYQQGLRLLEIDSSQIKELPEILDYLSKRGLNFIIFMDDLSFEEFETEYKYLKAVMEGGVESRPANVLFYATSNRRHLVREKWQDRESEVHKNDILNEKLSLAERFGLTLMFNNPSQKEYLEIVKKLADLEGLNIKSKKLENKALEWSKWHNGRSGRSARQFINHLLKNKKE